MHVMVAWSINSKDLSHKAQIYDALREELKSYSWVRALGDVYIVKITSEEDRKILGNGLKAVAKKFGEVNLIYSPAMEGGRYNGWLPRTLWAKIRQRVDDDVE